MSYATLQVGQGYLKNLGPLETDPQDGLTQDDVDAAEAYADARINTGLGKHYDISASAFQTAPMVEQIALLFGSAKLLEFKFGRDGVGDEGIVASLTRQAEDLMKAVRHTGLRDSAGGLIAPYTRAVIRVE